MKSNIISSNPTRTQLVVYCALFVAISVVLKLIFEIYIPLGGLPSLRVNLTFIPLFLGGILLGPIPGFAIGIISDLLCYVLKPNGPLFLGFTISSGLTGLIPGFLWSILKGRNMKWLRWLNIAISFFTLTYLLTSGAFVFDQNQFFFLGEPVNGFMVFLVLLIIILFSVFPFISTRILKKSAAQQDDIILFIVTVEQILNSIFLNTLWLSVLYGQAWAVLLPPRIITNIFLIPFYTIIIVFLLRAIQPSQMK